MPGNGKKQQEWLPPRPFAETPCVVLFAAEVQGYGDINGSRLPIDLARFVLPLAQCVKSRLAQRLRTGEYLRGSYRAVGLDGSLDYHAAADAPLSCEVRIDRQDG